MARTEDGFITQDDTEFMACVARRLAELDPTLGARLEHTGGGIFCVYLELADQGEYMYWGATGDRWRGEFYDLDGNFLDRFLTVDVASASQDAGAVAETIYTAVRKI